MNFDVCYGNVLFDLVLPAGVSVVSWPSSFAWPASLFGAALTLTVGILMSDVDFWWASSLVTFGFLPRGARTFGHVVAKAGLQLVQCWISSRSSPLAVWPTRISIEEVPRRLVMGKGPSYGGPNKAGFPRLTKTWDTLSKSGGMFTGEVLWCAG